MTSSSTSSSDDERERRAHRQLFKARHYRPRRFFHSIIKLMRELLSEDDRFIDYFGVNKEQFENLQDMLMAEINRSLSKFRNIKPIRGRDRLAICLRFLASGRSVRELSAMYKLQASIIETIIREVCNIIMQELQPIVMPRPTKKIWEKIAVGFKTLHQMPNCLGSVSGRYINIMNQRLRLFLAIVDAKSKFVMIDIGDYDYRLGSPWESSEMARGFNDNEMDVPPRKAVEGYPMRLPYVMVGSNSVPSKPYMLTKYADYECRDNNANKVFNNRINPVTEVAQEAMNRLRHRWRIMQSTFPVSPATVERYIMTVCCLENYCSSPPEKPDYPTEMAITNNKISSIRNMLPVRPSDTTEMFHQYFLSPEGQVPWQYSSLE